MKSVAIGSLNPNKIKAVRSAFQAVWPNEDFTFVYTQAKSKVDKQPKSDEEAINGAHARASFVRRKYNSDFGVGIEACIQNMRVTCGKHFKGQYLLRTWAVVTAPEVNSNFVMYHTGASSTLVLPRIIVAKIKNGMELGEVVDELFRAKNSKQKLGFWAYLSNGATTRFQENRSAVISALALFVKPELYKM